MTLTAATSFTEKIEQQRCLVDSLLDKYLPPVEQEPERLHEAMRYSVMAGGKRLRPVLALSAFEYCGGQTTQPYDEPIHRAMAALELVHTYSLIHDDLPCMDDDDLRRGMPTCHKKFGEAIAVLAGDALHDVAFELMARTNSPQTVIELAQAIGTSGMIGGQVADMQAEDRSDVSHAEITNIHMRKTGALIRSSVRIGAMLAGAENRAMTQLSQYGEKIGLAFQIIDDILDIEGDESLLGKATGADNKRKKATYPKVVGVEQARKDAQKLIDEAVALVQQKEDTMLTYVARFIGQREK